MLRYYHPAAMLTQWSGQACKSRSQAATLLHLQSCVEVTVIVHLDFADTLLSEKPALTQLQQGVILGCFVRCSNLCR